MTKPRLLDAYCGAGGATRGYQMAGFHVTGVDIKPQPRYVGDAFVQADALDYIREHGHEFDAIHASPPCQKYSAMTVCRPGAEHPDLVAATRDVLDAAGLPWVIENVPGAPLNTTIELCGSMFGLKVHRHRLFESSQLLMQPPHLPHAGRTGRAGRGASADGWISVAGHFSDVAAARLAMGIDWMTRDELSQAIPPAYTNFIGAQLLTVLSAKEVAA